MPGNLKFIKIHPKLNNQLYLWIESFITTTISITTTINNTTKNNNMKKDHNGDDWDVNKQYWKYFLKHF